jgi:type IV pilus assembly protein PilN
VLRQPRNAEVLDRSQFVNELLARKAVSWTKIFHDLERVVPHNVRVIQVRPQISGNNELLLDMIVASQAGENVLNLLMQLEASEVFGAVTPHSMLPPSQSDPLFRYRVSVRYAQKL